MPRQLHCSRWFVSGSPSYDTILQRRGKIVKVELPDEARKQAVASLRRYFASELDQEIGDLKAGLLLDFILQEIGPSIYNGAVADAQTYMRDRVADLEAVCAASEFTFWDAPAGKAPRRKSSS